MNLIDSTAQRSFTKLCSKSITLPHWESLQQSLVVFSVQLIMFDSKGVKLLGV